MPFKNMLQQLLERVPGAQGAIVVDWEGEAVEQVGYMDEFDLKLLGAHKGVVLHKMREALNPLNVDDLKELIITTGQAQIIVLPITNEYSLVLSINRSKFLGKALFESRQCLTSLYKEIV